ncbi:SAM-dependent methyltransferase [Kaistia algarum]|uniref:SAM-dependent methyltransferase n=1 Tax=Kaistia algarum TaxID=2083279 RepID=UPI001A9C4752|nr:cyclopropane-fatty-acyl-phospholipid synthase family protein [Kaistia algarum]MCX5512910.1 cyclopropane-fatty-acyl-phospholipid synthase [Kaistia algarum]
MSTRERYSVLSAGWLSPLSTDLAERLLRRLLRGLRHGCLHVETPSGRLVTIKAAENGPEATIRLKTWSALRRTLAGGGLGFADAYIAGEWSSPDLPALIEILAINAPHLGPTAGGGRLATFASRLRHRANENHRRGSRRNIAYHYDLGNEFYETWLDRGMQYSSAIYAEGDTLETAQQRKLDRITDWLGIGARESVLEIGFGWGAVAEKLAGLGCRVTGLTLSERQLAFASDRLAKGGLAADLRLQDYRDCTGTFDRIVSIEMIEAVGEKYWPLYFGGLRQRLAPGGRVVLQAITIDPGRFETYRRRPDFIQRHVFPGGMLPTVAILEQRATEAGLKLVRSEPFGSSYAQTLAEWRARFHDAWPTVARLGFDERFRRLWDYYLAYCEGGFRAGSIDVGLFEFRRQDDNSAPHA